MTEAVNSAVGRRLRNIREMLEVKVMDMADSLEISVGYYRKLERGDHAIRLPLLILSNNTLCRHVPFPPECVPYTFFHTNSEAGAVNRTFPLDFRRQDPWQYPLPSPAP